MIVSPVCRGPRRRAGSLVALRSGVPLVVVLLATFASDVSAQEARTSELSQKVDQLFAEWDKTSSPGCALGVIQDGELAYRRGYGMANLEHGVPISSSSVFYIASTSKQFVASSVILAAEQGYLSLDDDIRQHVPELPDYGEKISIRHLLNHTSGLRDYLTLWSLAGEEFADVHEPEEAVALIARQKQLNFQPGSEYLYSNSGYLLLAVIIERATGKKLREFAHDNIFAPLGMTHSHFHDDHTHISERRAIGHFKRDDGSIGMYVSNFDLVGSGGLHTSVDDLLYWVRNFYENRLGHGSLLEELHRRGILTSGDTIDYASGLSIGKYRGFATVSHGGSAQGYRTELLRFPDQRLSVIVLCNLGEISPTGLAREVADIFLARDHKLVEAAGAEGAEAAGAKAEYVTLSDERLESLAGNFRNTKTGTIWRISAESGRLKVQVDGYSFQLAPLSDTHFDAVDPAIHADVRFEPSARRFHAEFENSQAATFEEVELWLPDGSELAEFSGEYYSAELDASWELSIREGQLYIEDGPEQPLQPTVKDEFTLAGMTLMFERDRRGDISAIVADAGRVRGLRLIRKAE